MHSSNDIFYFYQTGVMTGLTGAMKISKELPPGYPKVFESPSRTIFISIKTTFLE